MAKVEFEIAKKLPKPLKKEAGIALRGLDLEPGKCSLLMLSDSYELFKEQIKNTEGLRYAVRGKSLEIFTNEDPKLLVQFGRGISFNSEDALDIFEYLEEAFLQDGYIVEAFTMNSGSFTVNCSAETDNKEALFEQLSASLDKYNMGVIK